MGKRVLVITGGEPGPDGGDAFSDFDLVIAADSGLERAVSLGVQPDVVIGDLDSALPESVEDARRGGSEIDAHPTEKDHTDFDLALRRAIEEQASEIAVIGGAGGRPDHWLANLGLMAAAGRAGIDVSAQMGGWSISVLVPGRPYSEQCPAGQVLSLLPMDGGARGVTTEGLAYPLRDEELPAGTSRGVSNVSSGGLVRVDIREGTLLVMRRNRDEVSP